MIKIFGEGELLILAHRAVLIFMLELFNSHFLTREYRSWQRPSCNHDFFAIKIQNIWIGYLKKSLKKQEKHGWLMSVKAHH